jgi:flagellar protein FliJ
MGARFRFSLQPLLDWRARVEEEKQRDFAAARRLHAQSVDELQRLADAYRRCAKQLAAAALTEESTNLRLRDSYLRFLDAAMARERSRRAELSAACDRARDQLVCASRERRAIEKLKERRLRDFEAEEARRQELEIDEQNARSHERRTRERLVVGRAESAAP